MHQKSSMHRMIMAQGWRDIKICKWNKSITNFRAREKKKKKKEESLNKKIEHNYSHLQLQFSGWTHGLAGAPDDADCWLSLQLHSGLTYIIAQTEINDRHTHRNTIRINSSRASSIHVSLNEIVYTGLMANVIILISTLAHKKIIVWKIQLRFEFDSSMYLSSKIEVWLCVCVSGLSQRAHACVYMCVCACVCVFVCAHARGETPSPPLKWQNKQNDDWGHSTDEDEEDFVLFTRRVCSPRGGNRKLGNYSVSGVMNSQECDF